MGKDNCRVSWIDCAKSVAIMAVVVDHSNGVFYSNSLIATYSYFSVSLFVILSGMSVAISASRRGIPTYYHQFCNLLKVLRNYAIAVFIIQCFEYKSFDLKTYISHVLNFDIQAPFYFLVFFFQLMIIAPFLLRWCYFCKNNKYRIVMQTLTLIILGWISYITINYTYILPVWGGGQYLLGGTYIILYYIGIMLCDCKVFSAPKKMRIIMLIASALCWGVWGLLMNRGIIDIDKRIEKYWGNGFNPPSVEFMVFAIISLILCYSLFSLLEESNIVLFEKIFGFMSWLGKYTLYVFMYHLTIRSAVLRCFPNITKYINIYRFVFVLMIIIPAIAVYGIGKFVHRIENSNWKN